MDEPTATFYAEGAVEIAARYDAVASPMEPYFSVAFPRGSRVLDVGAGSGRDLAALIALGYDAYGAEPIDALRGAASANHKELVGRLMPGSLPGIGEPFGGGFEGVLCSAVLMHVPEEDLFDSVMGLRRLLRPHGRLLVSLPLTRGDLASSERDDAGRLFKNYPPEYLRLVFERLEFQQIGRWNTGDALCRTGTTWYTLLFELHAGGSVRAVDQIEGILNRDKKVATYKLALFRALAEIALLEPRAMSWRTDGKVGVPLSNIAERWLLYYWPIFASARFLPQSAAEGKGERNPVAFRAPVTALIDAFKGQGEHGGLSAWHFAWSAGKLDVDVGRMTSAALSSISKTIVGGPVAFAGGSLDSGLVFEYDGAAREVLMSADLWRELSLQGHWIIDAVILRWAALSERFSYRQGITAGDVLPLLLAQPTEERANGFARQVFIEAGVTRCAWSDRFLGAGFAVDHLIPFALWGCNDLWNLLPVDGGVNRDKSDKLPAADLLVSRRESIIACWTLLRAAAPEAFRRQASQLLGREIGGHLSWQDDLFARLRQAVEIVAMQRGAERWKPRAQVSDGLDVDAVD